MHVDHATGRAAFLSGLAGILDVAEALDDDQLLAASWCRGWTVGDVLVHVHLGLQAMLLGLVSSTEAEPDTDAAGYWRAFPPDAEPTPDHLGQLQFVRRMSAAYRRPVGLVAHLRQTADGVRAAAAILPEAPVPCQGMVLDSGDFLTAWAVELAVHQLDLGRDLALAPPAPDALGLARATVEHLAGERLPDMLDDVSAVLAGSGRIPPDAAGPAAGLLPVLG